MARKRAAIIVNPVSGQARARRSGWLVYIGVEPAFDKLHSNPAFAQLVGQTVSVRPL